MIKDITIGQYFPGRSPVHRLDPRVKILLALGYIVLLFIAQNAWGLGLGVVLGFGAYLISQIPLVMILKSLKPVVPIIIFTAVLNMLFVDYQNHQGGSPHRCLYGGAHRLPHRRNLPPHLHHLPHRPHRRYRAADESPQALSLPGPRACHDDDHRPALYPHPHRGDG